ncbi:MAG: alkaline phosphatase family protein [Planctomycetes bacterium]|nr:alkaline phosphatase family protein [Planctomycetota bacterium]
MSARNVCTLVLLLCLGAAAARAEEPRKAVVLGIDALDKRLMDQWMAEGRLPNFKRLAEQGHYSALETSYPPMSPAAWSTMTTGLNPGKTGIFGFIRRKEGSYEPELALVAANEQPVLGGNPANRAAMALLGAFAAFALFLLPGRLLRKRSLGALLPACVAVGLALLAPVPMAADGPFALGALGGLVLGAAVFALLAAVGRLGPRTWVVPVLALATGAFGLLNRLPETMPFPRTNRSGDTFWSMADRHGLRCKVLGAPVSWPAHEDLLQSSMNTGLATPDAMASFHTYTLFTEPHHELAGSITEMSGRVERLVFEGDVAPAVLQGPPARFDHARWRAWEHGDAARMPREEIPFTITRAADGGVDLRFTARDVVEESEVHLKPGEWKKHLRVRFDLGGLVWFHGTVSFKLLAGGQQVRLYATPVMLDAAEQLPPFAVTQPISFGPWLVEHFGQFQTLGWAEATSALNDGVIDDWTFVETCFQSFDERSTQLLGLLDQPESWDLLAVFTYDMDRICHMMWRHMDAAHPAHDPTAPPRLRHAIRDFYERYDALLGKVLERLPRGALLLLCSDHGFAPFYRSVNVNRWLIDQGYLVLKRDTGKVTMEHLFDNRAGYYEPYDWSRTRAYALGLNTIYLNLRRREPQGVVEPGAEAEKLRNQIMDKLRALRDDPAHGGKPVFHGVWRREEVWQGPRIGEAGDILLGYDWGYRVSWQTTLGGANEPVIADNLKNWSGDHCSFDPALVPGVVLCNRPLAAPRLRLVDAGLTVLEYFGVPLPAGRNPHDGKPWAVK